MTANILGEEALECAGESRRADPTAQRWCLVRRGYNGELDNLAIVLAMLPAGNSWNIRTCWQQDKEKKSREELGEDSSCRKC